MNKDCFAYYSSGNTEICLIKKDKHCSKCSFYKNSLQVINENTKLLVAEIITSGCSFKDIDIILQEVLKKVKEV